MAGFDDMFQRKCGFAHMINKGWAIQYIVHHACDMRLVMVIDITLLLQLYGMGVHGAILTYPFGAILEKINSS